MSSDIDKVEKINIMIAEIEDVITSRDPDFKRFMVIKDKVHSGGMLNTKEAKTLNKIHERLAQ